MKSKFSAILIILSAIMAGVVFGREYGLVFGVIAGFAFASALSFSAMQSHGRLGITIAANLKQAKILDAALSGFQEVIIALEAFSTAYYDIPLLGTDKVVVPYYPIETAASRDFNGTYILDTASQESRELTIDKRKYQSLSYTSAELRRQPFMNPEKYGLNKGRKLAVDVIKDVLSIVTAGNFPDEAFVGAASGFDSDDTADIQKLCDDSYWPEIGRSLLLNTAFYTALTKDSDVKTSPSAAITEDAMIRGEVPEVSGFKIRKALGIPTNGEYLAGAAVYQSAILVGFSPIQPAPEVMAALTRYATQTAEGGITLEYREWGNPGTDSVAKILECNYGKAKGEAAALKRIKTQ